MDAKENENCWKSLRCGLGGKYYGRQNEQWQSSKENGKDREDTISKLKIAFLYKKNTYERQSLEVVNLGRMLWENSCG